MKSLYSLLLITFIGCTQANNETTYWVNKLENAVRDYGYTCRTHVVVTSDDYVLRLFELGKTGVDSSEKPPVLIIGPMMCGSGVAVIGGKKVPAVFSLVDAGYRVILGSTREQIYSRGNLQLNPDTDTKRFWDFSWNEMGVYDAPTMIDFILSNSTYTKLFLIGYSQGCTTTFVLLSEKPEYQNKIIACYLMAPPTALSHAGIVMKTLVTVLQVVYPVFALIGQYELTRPLLLPVAPVLVLTPLLTRWSGLIELLQLLKWVPQPASYKTFRHYGQCLKGTFKKFDYGSDKNLEKYGSVEPPSYIINTTTIPMYLIYSDGDEIVTTPDVEILFSKLPAGNKYLWKVDVPFFGHFDFFTHVKSLATVFQPIIQNMDTRWP